MYRGGEIISALDVESYEETKQLGLICPFCSEALFLNSGGIRKRGEKMQFINPHFSHYKCGVSGLDCEKRSHTTEGKKRIVALRGEARNQRLKLYNMYLWQMAADDRNISNQMLGQIASQHGRKACEQTAIAIHKEWHKYQADLYTLIDSSIKGMKNVTPESVTPSWANNQIWAQEELLEQKEYFSRIDQKLHLAICHEIVDFLSTSSSGYAFYKIFIVSLRLLEMSFFPRKVNLKAMQNSRHAILSMGGFIAGTRWVEQIQKRI